MGGNSMSDTIKGAIVGAIITVAGSLLIFYLGQFSTQETLEKSTVEVLSNYFEYIDINMSYKDALQVLYNQSLEQQRANELLKQQLETAEIKNQELNSIIITTQQEFENSQQELKDAENDANIVIAAKQYAENDNLKNAIVLLAGVNSPTSEMKVLFDDYKQQYKEQIIIQTTSLCGEGKYEDAIELINDALILIPNDVILKEQKEKINQSKPHKLMNTILPYEKYGYTEKLSTSMLMGGKEYYYGFQLGDGWKKSYANFNLEAKYNTITVTIGHIDGSGEVNKTVNVYADEILIDTIEVDYQALPDIYTYNIKGIERLTFERSDGTTQTGFGEIIIR